MIATVTFNPSLDEWVTLSSLKLGVLNRAAGWSRYAGGKGINVSRVVRELGGRTIAFGLAGGEDGTILRERLNRMTLPHVFVDVPGSTRNNYKIQSALPPALTEINCPGPRVRAAAINRLQRALLRQA
ncbi:MAG: 1-phosphofructokinase, partial [Armatimonadetes bacterium]|nr:1-phosphofructokinase [Armatimonadota bacterium]